jgi:hypothetical protein
MVQQSSLSLYTSSGQSFTQRGRPSKAGATSSSYARGEENDFEGAAEDLYALSERLLVISKQSAVELADVLTGTVKEYLRNLRRQAAHPGSREGTGEVFEYSMGRLAAAWGTYTPEMIQGEVDVYDNTPIQAKHEAWCEENGVSGGGGVIEGTDMGEEKELNMGAFTEIKRYKASVWTAEVGTFVPYAPLVNDGGTMLIHPYGNPKVIVEATWEGVHFMEFGIARAEQAIPNIVQGSVSEALAGIPGRRKVRNPKRRE